MKLTNLLVEDDKHAKCDTFLATWFDELIHVQGLRPLAAYASWYGWTVSPPVVPHDGRFEALTPLRIFS